MDKPITEKEEKSPFKSVVLTMRTEDYEWIMETFGEKSWVRIVQELREAYEQQRRCKMLGDYDRMREDYDRGVR